MSVFRLNETQRVRWIRLQIDLIDAERAMRDRQWAGRRDNLRAMLVKNGPDVLDSGCDCEDGSPCSESHMDRAMDLNSLDAQMLSTDRGAYAVAVTNLNDFVEWAERRADDLRTEGSV